MRTTILVSLLLIAGLGCQLSQSRASSAATTASTTPAPTADSSATHEAPALPSGGYGTTDFTRHVDQLKKSLPSREFSIVVQPPFVVVGDEPSSEVKRRAEGTVKWAVDRLKQDFFAKDPNEILNIWLFKDEASYKKHTRMLFGEEPTTPYGYYSRKHRALIMNIGTGGGTLVHEIVHPFVEANFPAAPPWLNEGLGSLYEQCGEVDGHIHGFTNWRLPGLQRAIRAGEVPSFKTLMEMDANTFYNHDKGVNYAQARYLCYYLQEKGLLLKFYGEFHASHRRDSSGYKTLQRILGEPDMDVFKKKWEKFVLGLRVGYSVNID
ncbi:MAG TPA: hypothetical protein VJM12_12890 [Pyrinomonadaceae bacterium]|nr:hypothetical protein [Pyrinomonadaceae bacterium]